MPDQTYFLLRTKIEGVQLINGLAGVCYQNYPVGSPVTVPTLEDALALVMSGDFAWYGPAPGDVDAKES